MWPPASSLPLPHARPCSSSRGSLREKTKKKHMTNGAPAAAVTEHPRRRGVSRACIRWDLCVRGGVVRVAALPFGVGQAASLKSPEPNAQFPATLSSVLFPSVHHSVSAFLFLSLSLRSLFISLSLSVSLSLPALGDGRDHSCLPPGKTECLLQPSLSCNCKKRVVPKREAPSAPAPLSDATPAS